ncbi:MAG: hypothetical protein MJZ25_16440 [Fibrobacter sp.]|nr:hypothetical protein [Fibrobacter sp.]
MFFVVIVQNHKKIAKIVLTIVDNCIRLPTKPIELAKIIIKMRFLLKGMSLKNDVYERFLSFKFQRQAEQKKRITNDEIILFLLDMAENKGGK